MLGGYRRPCRRRDLCPMRIAETGRRDSAGPAGAGCAGPTFKSLLDTLDGLLLTGSQSNVAPARYGVASQRSWRDARSGARRAEFRADPCGRRRRRAAAGDLPRLPGDECRFRRQPAPEAARAARPHRSPRPFRAAGRCPIRYGASGRSACGGRSARACSAPITAMVNSVHWQGVDRLADGLAVEAVAPDGTIEAVRVADAGGFTLAVQWHPEHRPAENPVSRAIFAAFRCGGYETCRRAHRVKSDNGRSGNRKSWCSCWPSCRALGPRSARRAALTMLKKRDTIMAAAWPRRSRRRRGRCAIAASAATSTPTIHARSAAIRIAIPHMICVVEEVADLWALERSGAFRGRYHVLGGTLVAVPGRRAAGSVDRRAGCPRPRCGDASRSSWR